VSNHQSLTVEAVGDDGALSAREGDQRVVLEPVYVATAAQLGYATTDHANQGVTTGRSLTWVGEATSAAGLYVGATRGRYANTVHVVAGALEGGHRRPPRAGEVQLLQGAGGVVGRPARSWAHHQATTGRTP